jgi:glycosyltransferase involved in cell wall biosynthesis
MTVSDIAREPQESRELQDKVLSIVVPSYNVEHYLAKGLSTYADPRLQDALEVLIVNDGSTDATAEIAQRFVDAWPSLFKLITKENGGHGSAVNTGLAHASGTYFRIIDGDDWAHTDNLVRLIETLRSTSADLVIDVKREVRADSDDSKLFPLPDTIPLDGDLAFTDVCLRAEVESSFMIHTISARTDFLKEHDLSLLEHTFYVDYEFIVKATCLAQTVRFLNLELCQYQVGSLTQSVNPDVYAERFDDHSRVVEELLRYASTLQVDETRKAYVASRVHLLINTHYNIALIFDKDRARGLQRARQFRAWLKEHYPSYCAATNRRYHQARILHTLGFNATHLDHLMGRT